MEWFRRLLGSSPRPEVETRLPPAAPPPPSSVRRAVYTRYGFSEPHVRIAAVGDLHGRIDLLDQLGLQLDILARDTGKRLIEVYLGDYVDRGGNARAVLDFLANRTGKSDREVICLQGNHEQLLLAALESDRDFLSWLDMGGQSTLGSYGIAPRAAKADPTAGRMALRAAMPPAHRDFLMSLRLSFACGGFFFVHAGVHPGRPLEHQRPTDMLWIRSAFVTSNADFGAIVVHGHTPTARPQFRANRIGIDTGAHYSGLLTCLLVTSESVSVLEPPARTPAAALLLP